MKDEFDVLTVCFKTETGIKGQSFLSVSRKEGEKTIILKMVAGEQADILHYLLTEQMAEAELKTERREQ